MKALEELERRWKCCAKIGPVRPWYGLRAIQEGVWVNHRRCLDEGADIGRVYGPQGRTATVHPIRSGHHPDQPCSELCNVWARVKFPVVTVGV